MTERRYYDPAIQTMAPEELRRLQGERLARQLDRVWSVPVPFFRRKLEAAGLRRADLRRLDDLALVPTTVKAELRESEEEHPPFGDYRGAPPSACVRLGASTGTSGRPTLILWTRKDLEVDYAASARGRWRWGLRPGMSLANAHPFGMNAGGWHFSHGIEALGVLNIPSGPPVGETHIRDVIEVWRRVRPNMYRLFGNVSRTYADAARAMGLDPERDLNLTIAGDHPAEQYLMASSGLEALPLLGSACDERDGAHLSCEVPLSFATATLGGVVDVPTLEGEVSLKVPPESQSGRVFRLRGKGIQPARGGAQGDLFCRVVIETPVKLSTEQRELLLRFDESLRHDGNRHAPRQKSFLEGVKRFFKAAP